MVFMGVVSSLAFLIVYIACVLCLCLINNCSIVIMHNALYFVAMTLNELERHNGVISLNLVSLRCRKRSVAEFMQVSIVFSSACI